MLMGRLMCWVAQGLALQPDPSGGRLRLDSHVSGFSVAGVEKNYTVETVVLVLCIVHSSTVPHRKSRGMNA